MRSLRRQYNVPVFIFNNKGCTTSHKSLLENISRFKNYKAKHSSLQLLTSVTFVQLALRSPLLHILLFLLSPLFSLLGWCTLCLYVGRAAPPLSELYWLSTSSCVNHVCLSHNPALGLWLKSRTLFELYQIFLKSFTLWDWPHCEHQVILKRSDWDRLDATSFLTVASSLINLLVHRCSKQNHQMVNPVFILTSRLCQFVV